MINLQLVEEQPHWRVWLVARFAQLIGVVIHVEGIPFGSNRSRKSSPSKMVGEASSGASNYVSDRVFDGIRPISKERSDQLREAYRKGQEKKLT